jgi:hypothetical protein
MDQEDYGVGYIEEDHPLRPQAAAQSLALLQVPDKSGRRSRNTSISSSVTDLDAPIYTREDVRSTQRHVSTSASIQWALQTNLTLKDTFLRSVLQLLFTANIVLSSLIIFTLTMEAMRSSEMSVLTRATRLCTSEDCILHSHRHEALKSYNSHFAFRCCSCRVT